jgi:hypothetical protein
MDEISAVHAVGGGKQLTAAQQAEVARLAARDRDVRAHEQSHMAAAGSLASGIEYTYQIGPDGRMYAVSGKVQISVPPGLSPAQELADARQVRAAAEAPNDPSGQDMIVATQASQMEAKAQDMISKEHAQRSQLISSHHTAATPFRGLDRKA